MAARSGGAGIRDAKWFDGARLNFAENLLRHTVDAATAGKAALVSRHEQGRHRVLTRAQLLVEGLTLTLVIKLPGLRSVAADLTLTPAPGSSGTWTSSWLGRPRS